MSTADSDITTLSNPSSTGSQEDTILNLQAKLWHLLSIILNSESESRITSFHSIKAKLLQLFIKLSKPSWACSLER